MLCNLPGWFVKNRSKIFSFRVGIFTICSRLKFFKFSRKSSYIFLSLHELLGLSFSQSKSGRLKSPRIQIVLFWGIFLTAFHNSVRLFSLFSSFHTAVQRLLTGTGPQIQINNKLKEHTLEVQDCTKYLGADLHSSLSWKPHIDRITKKANTTLKFLRRNLKAGTEDTKANPYFCMVRPNLEYWNGAPQHRPNQESGDDPTPRCTFMKTQAA